MWDGGTVPQLIERSTERLAGLRADRGAVALDGALILVLAAAAVRHLAAGGLNPASLPWLVVLLGPLAWRRKAPLAVFMILAAASTVMLARLPGGLDSAQGQLLPVAVGALLVALATGAARWPRGLSLGCAAILGGWGFEVLGRWSPVGALSLTATSLWLCAVAAAALTGMYAQTHRAYTSALRERSARLERELDQQARMAVVEERTRIARELHDIVSHNLSVIIALADGAAATSPDPGAGLMRQVASTGRQAIGDMSHILGLLRENDLVDWRPQPGIDQLAELVAETRTTGLPTRLLVSGTRRQLGSGLELTVYRIVQEALTNIRKHACEVTRAQVRLDYRAEDLEIEVVDDGRPARPGTGFGHGLTGMRERAAAFAGSLEAGPAPEGGWRIRVLLAAPDADRPPVGAACTGQQPDNRKRDDD
jgi:signal transduction histidine kinase